MSEIAKKMIAVIGIVALVFVAVSTAVIYLRYPSASAVYFSLGIIMTSSLNVLKIIMLERSVNKALNTEEGKSAKGYVYGQYIFRYVLTAIVLFAAVKISPSTLWGAIAGIFTLQISVYAMKFFMRKDEKTSEN